MKIIFKDLNGEISDALIKDLAYNLCIPAFYEFALRAKTKSSLNATLKSLHTHITNSGFDLPSYGLLISYSKNQLHTEASKLTLINPKVYEAPVRSLASVFNSQKINKLILEERISLNIGHISKFINFNNLRFTNHDSPLTKREMASLKASFLFLNWFLVKRTYYRPNVNSLRFLCSRTLLNIYKEKGIGEYMRKNKIESNKNFIKLKLDNKETGLNFLRLYSNQLHLFLNNLSDEKISTLIRLKKLNDDMSKEGLIERNTLEKLPIFILLNKRNFVMFKTLQKLYNLGYTRIVHLKFLDKNCIKLVQNQKLANLLRE